MNVDIKHICDRTEWVDPLYNHMLENAFMKGIPISGTFELTPRCNFNCKMCYVHLKENEIAAHGKELNSNEWLHIADEAKKAGTLWLCITGGEPLLHPEFPEIWAGLSKMGFFLTLQTNASLIKGDVLKLLKQYPPRHVKITLYGSNDEVYQAVCGVKNGFTRVNDGIHTLMSMGIPITLVSTIIKQNAHDAQKMAFYAYKHHLPWASTIGIKPSLRGADTDIEATQVREKIEASIKADICKMIETNKFMDVNRKPASFCRDYRIGYWILWDGTMRFCSFLDEPNFSICDMEFKDAWSKLLEYEETLEWPTECKQCASAKICKKCAAMIFTKKKEDSLECFITKHFKI